MGNGGLRGCADVLPLTPWIFRPVTSNLSTVPCHLSRVPYWSVICRRVFELNSSISAEFSPMRRMR